MTDRRILALDLEATLITNVISQFPRPGLKHFLEEVSKMYSEVVIYTFVSSGLARSVLSTLEAEGYVPEGFSAKVCIFRPEGRTKDLTLIDKPSRVLLIDDNRNVIHPGQDGQVIIIKEYGEVVDRNSSVMPDQSDRELSFMLKHLQKNFYFPR